MDSFTFEMWSLFEVHSHLVTVGTGLSWSAGDRWSGNEKSGTREESLPYYLARFYAALGSFTRCAHALSHTVIKSVTRRERESARSMLPKRRENFVNTEQQSGKGDGEVKRPLRHTWNKQQGTVEEID